ncbi:PQQ-dependent sugar dehydrogenase [Aliifodinibius salicampi]|uniref:PQQ-dependent sugar dehydrogenase n=1 Tax=Fodinibius salicampi TaxID=1920655 RepID=A0ABT3Q149_9BACT|nr:PQQ-dependent sugar dehydrogenase [Fodinibius salicampi]MCW9713763.1 PQQ-dependent sugar dehydrogenase [Fodinibius salicampi]
MDKSLAIYFLLVLFVGCSNGSEMNENTEAEEPVSPEYTTETVISGDDIPLPWGMAWLPDGDMLVTNRDGELYLVSDGQRSEPLDGVPEVWANSQGGLLDIELHPNYEETGWVYITYSSVEGEGEGANTALMRAQLNDDRTGLVENEVLYKAVPNTDRGQHFGSRIKFDDEGYLYFSIGDRGNRDENPQDITRDGGKIYRLNDDGSIPEGNPFVGEENAKEGIYSYGHRNPQGMDFNSETGQIWVHEHGPRGGDEVNIIEPGNNYGWPEISFGINYDGTSFTEDTAKAGMEQPEWYWDPSIAPSGMAFVTSDVYPNWQGDLLVGSLKFNYLVWCKINDGSIIEEEIIFEDIGRVRDVEQAPDGHIYVATEGKGIQRIVREEE